MISFSTRALLKKNKLIEHLMMDLDEAEEQYNMAFRAEVDMMTEMMDIHGARFELIFSNTVFP